MKFMEYDKNQAIPKNYILSYKKSSKKYHVIVNEQKRVSQSSNEKRSRKEKRCKKIKQ